MQKLNAKGFGTLAVLALVIVVAALGGGGYYVWHKNHDKKKTTASTTSSSSSSQSNNTTNTQTTDPYAGWKTYTDSQNHYSFKYPSDWTLSAGGSQGIISATILNPSKTAEVDYASPYVHDSGLVNFNPASVNDLTVGGMSMKIVGGVYTTSASEADYGVVDSSFLQTYPLTIGQDTQFPNALRFTSMNQGTSTTAFRARTTTTLSSADAKSWFNTSDAKTSLLILKSLTYNK